MKHKFLLDDNGFRFVPISHIKSTFVDSITPLSAFFTEPKENILSHGTFLKKKVAESGGVISITDNNHYTCILVDVKPNTIYYINRSSDSSTSNGTNNICLVAEDNTLSLPLWADGSEGSISVMQVFPNGGVFKTRSTTKQVYIMLDYSSVSVANRVLSPKEYLIESNVSYVPEEYLIAPQPLSYPKPYKILLIGSSYGINSVMALPPLAKSAGIDVVVGNIYGSSMSIETAASHCNNTDILTYGYFDSRFGLMYHGGNTNISPRGYAPTMYNILSKEEWDCVILMRAAAQSQTAWSDSNSTALATIIDYIAANSKKKPRILFDTAWAGADSASYDIDDIATLATQTTSINAAVAIMQQKFGLDVIPYASFIQDCRVDTIIDSDGLLMNNNNGIHLNAGIGMYATACLTFEKILSPLYGKSILSQTHIHTKAELAQVYSNSAAYPIMSMSSADYVSPTEEQAKRIRRYAAAAAIGAI